MDIILKAISVMGGAGMTTLMVTVAYITLKRDR